MINFTPYSALAGGVLIGLAAALLMLWLGRIAGISGIFNGAIGLGADGDRVWRRFFLAGLLFGPVVLMIAKGSSGIPHFTISAPVPVLLAAGLLVGYGTQLGNGCTSGHGVCGIARWSRRSLAATATFMITAALTVYVVRHQLGGW